MRNMNNTYYGKTTMSKNKGKTQNIGVNYRNEIIDPDVFYRQHDENVSLKKQLQQLELENKKLSVKNKQYESKNKKLNDRINKDPEYIKEENSKQEYIKDNQTLKIEYENLKNKNKRLNEQVNIMQKKLGKLNKPKNTKYRQNSQSDLKARYPNAYQIYDYENLINNLQNSLKAAHQDRRNLLNEIINMKDGGLSKIKMEYSENVKNNNLKLTELSLELDKLKVAYERNQKILNITKQCLDEYTEKYEIERNKNNQLENELQMQQNSLEKLDEYTAMIENYKKKEKMLEDKISELCESPFIKQINTI